MFSNHMKQIRKFVGEPFVAAVIAFLGSFIITSRILSIWIKNTCRDGWESPSIGVQGACSWHGGVTDGGKGAIAAIVSLLIAILIAMRRDIVTGRRAKKEQLLTDTASKIDAANRGIACPKCGFYATTKISQSAKSW